MKIHDNWVPDEPTIYIIDGKKNFLKLRDMYKVLKGIRNKKIPDRFLLWRPEFYSHDEIIKNLINEGHKEENLIRIMVYEYTTYEEALNIER